MGSRTLLDMCRETGVKLAAMLVITALAVIVACTPSADNNQPQPTTQRPVGSSTPTEPANQPGLQTPTSTTSVPANTPAPGSSTPGIAPQPTSPVVQPSGTATPGSAPSPTPTSLDPGGPASELVSIISNDLESDAASFVSFQAAYEKAAKAFLRLQLLTDSTLMIDAGSTSFEEYRSRLDRAIVAAEIASVTAANLEAHAQFLSNVEQVKNNELSFFDPDHGVAGFASFATKADPDLARAIRDNLTAAWNDGGSLRQAIRASRMLGADSQMISRHLENLRNGAHADAYNDEAATHQTLETTAIIIKDTAAVAVFAGSIATAGTVTLLQAGAVAIQGTSLAATIAEDTFYLALGRDQDPATFRGLRTLSDISAVVTFSPDSIAENLLWLAGDNTRIIEDAAITLGVTTDRKEVSVAAETRDEGDPPIPDLAPILEPGIYRDSDSGSFTVEPDNKVHELVEELTAGAPETLDDLEFALPIPNFANRVKPDIPNELKLVSLFEQFPDENGWKEVVFEFQNVSPVAIKQLAGTIDGTDATGERQFGSRIDGYSEQHIGVIRPGETYAVKVEVATSVVVYDLSNIRVTATEDKPVPDLIEFFKAEVYQRFDGEFEFKGRVRYNGQSRGFPIVVVELVDDRGVTIEIAEKGIGETQPGQVRDVVIPVGNLKRWRNATPERFNVSAVLARVFGAEFGPTVSEVRGRWVTISDLEMVFSRYIPGTEVIAGSLRPDHNLIVEVENTGETLINNIRFRILGEENAFPPRIGTVDLVVAPGERTAFRLSFSDNDGSAVLPTAEIASWDVPLDAQPVSPINITDQDVVHFASITEATPEDVGNNYWFSVEGQNATDENVDLSHIIGTFRDSAGNVIWVERENPSFNARDYAPGETQQIVTTDGDGRSLLHIRLSDREISSAQYLPVASCPECPAPELGEPLRGTETPFFFLNGLDDCLQFESNAGIELCEELAEFKDTYGGLETQTGQDCDELKASQKVACIATVAAESGNPELVKSLGDEAIFIYISLSGDVSLIDEIKDDEVWDLTFMSSLKFAAAEGVLPPVDACSRLRGGYPDDDVNRAICENANVAVRALVLDDIGECAIGAMRIPPVPWDIENRENAQFQCEVFFRDIKKLTGGP